MPKGIKLVDISVHEAHHTQIIESGARRLWKETIDEAAALQKVTLHLKYSTMLLNNAARKMFCRLMNLSLNSLGRTCSTTYSIKRAIHSSMKTSSQQ